MVERMKKFGYYFGIPIGCWLFYLTLCLGLQRIGSVSTMTAMFVGDVVCCVLFGILYYVLCVKSTPKEDRKLFKFAGKALFLLFALFLWQYIFGQATSAWIGIQFPSEYIDTYQKMSDSEMIMYLFLAVSFGPIVEELLFRGLFYKHLRKHFGVLFCFIFSALAFGFSHGTTEHLPLTLGLSLLVCFVYEITGNMLYCILIHSLSNLVSMAYILQVPISFGFSVAMFLLYVLLMFGMLATVPFFRQWMMYDKEKPTFTAKLEEKRKHWADGK